MTHANIIATSPTAAAPVANDDDHYIVSWAGICKPHLVRVYPHTCADGTVDMTVPVAMDAAGLIPYDGSEGPVMDVEAAEGVLDSAIYDGPCCPTFESRAKGYQRVTCCYLSNSFHCARRGGCTATPLPRPIKSGKQTPPVKTDATITTLRRLGRIVDTYAMEHDWTRVSDSGVYESTYTMDGVRHSITIQAAPGRVRLTVGGPWMPVSKRHITKDERKALQDAWLEARYEESKSRHAVKEALRKSYGGNCWQRHLLECANFAKRCTQRQDLRFKAGQASHIATLEGFAKVVDCELSMRYAICMSYDLDPFKDSDVVGYHVARALEWTAP